MKRYVKEFANDMIAKLDQEMRNPYMDPQSKEDGTKAKDKIRTIVKYCEKHLMSEDEAVREIAYAYQLAFC